MKRMLLPPMTTLQLGDGMAWAGPQEDLFDVYAAYDSCQGVVQNYAEAFKPYRLAVARGNAAGRERCLPEARCLLTYMGAKGQAERLAREPAR